jgi:Uma2 family endonuclease
MVKIMSVVATERKKFTVEEYYKLGEVGILGPDDRVELIDGDIVYMAPIGTRHASCVNRLVTIFSELVTRKMISLPVQNPVHIDAYSDVQPDVVVAKPDQYGYEDKHPEPEDILLLIEVADTTIRRDREKAIIYGRAGIIELWIVNLEAQLVEVDRDPTANGYTNVQRFRRGDTISPLAFSELVVSVDIILGRERS